MMPVRSFWLRHWWPIHWVCLTLSLLAVSGAWIGGQFWARVVNAFFAGVMLNGMVYQPLLRHWQRIADEAMAQTEAALRALQAQDRANEAIVTALRVAMPDRES